MEHLHDADKAGTGTPTNDEARSTPHAAGPFDQHTHTDFAGLAFADQAARVIEGEQYATAYLDRLQAQMAQPGELAALLAYLSGEALHGACRLIEKALEGRHHA